MRRMRRSGATRRFGGVNAVADDDASVDAAESKMLERVIKSAAQEMRRGAGDTSRNGGVHTELGGALAREWPASFRRVAALILASALVGTLWLGVAVRGSADLEAGGHLHTSYAFAMPGDAFGATHPVLLLQVYSEQS
eukprot:gene30824-35940_t